MADVKLPHISRRALLGAAGATAATSSMGWAAVKKEVETLKKKGWKAYRGRLLHVRRPLRHACYA